MNNDSVKYSAWIKALCFVLSTVLFVLFVFNALCAVRPLAYFSPEDLQKESNGSFFDSAMARDTFYIEICDLNLLCSQTPDEYEKELKSKKDKQIETAYNQFISEKIEIIRSELLYVVRNYNNGYDPELASGITEGYINSIPDTPAGEQKYPVDANAPAGVRVAQKIMNYAEGEDFLKYQSLVRDDAFYGSFSPENIVLANVSEIGYALSETQAKSLITEGVNNRINDSARAYRNDYTMTADEVEKLVNIKYYIKTGDKVLTNMKNKDAEIKTAAEHSCYLVKENGKLNYKGSTHSVLGDDMFKDCSELTVYMVNENELSGEDIVTNRYDAFNETNYDIKPYAIKAVVFFILAAAALIVMLNLSGHKRHIDGITLSFIDKVPGDVHFIVSAGLIAAGCVGAAFLLDEMFDEYNIKLFDEFSQPILLIAAVVWMLLTELIAGIVRTAKSDRAYFGNFLIVKLFKFLLNLIKKIFSKIGRSVKSSALRYRPKHFKRRIIALGALIAVVSPFFGWFVSVLFDDYVTGLTAACIAAAAGIAAMVFFAKYVRNLDRIVEASQNRKSVDFKGEELHQSLEILNDSLKISNEEVAAAVEKAVKNERTKTELITNVSHDLKTPLTSVISYVDLLKSCDINDEDAKKYIGIIDEKSAALKVLIENLIEASKVSAGNVKLNIVDINLKELVIQGLVEYQTEFENRNLDLRFNENCESVTVLADGQQTYRIIENLLSNAKKYSAPDTRVYSSIREENGFGVFEIKNTSKEPLDISPEELTERFVRGDASRGEEEGNGLGLSIAKELCSLQGGRLEISIDGDLFKASVYLPVK